MHKIEIMLVDMFEIINRLIINKNYSNVKLFISLNKFYKIIVAIT